MTEPSGPANADDVPAVRAPLRWRTRAALRGRRELARRSLGALAGPTRLLWWALVGAAAVSGAMLASAIIGQPLGAGPTPWALVIGLINLTTTTMALAGAAASTLDDPAGAERPVGWPLRAAVGVLGLSGLAVLLVGLVPGLRDADPMLGDVLGLLLWSGFGCCACAYHRLQVAGVTPRQRAWSAVIVIVGSAGLIGLAVAVTAVAGKLPVAFGLLKGALVVVSFAAVVLVPTILVRAGLAGLAKSRDHGEVAARVLREDPGRAVWFLVAKAAVLLVMAVLIPLWWPGATLVSTHPLSWVGALVAAGLVVVLLWFDHRPWPARKDLRVVGSAAALLVAVPLAILIAVAFVMGMTPVVGTHPWQALGVVVVSLAAWVPARRPGGRWRRGIGWTVAAGLGAAGWLTMGRAPVLPGPTQPVTGPTMELVVPLLSWSLVTLTVACIVLAIVRRQARLLTYLTAVALWIALNVSYPLWTPGVLALDIDLALTVLLVLGVLGYAKGFTRRIDPAEAVVVSVALLLVMDVPVLLSFAPVSWTTWVLAIGALTAIGTAFWSELPVLARPERRRSAFRSLSLTCLASSATVGLAWTVGTTNVGLPEGLANLVLAYLSLPIAVVLASHSLRRPEREPVAR